MDRCRAPERVQRLLRASADTRRLAPRTGARQALAVLSPKTITALTRAFVRDARMRRTLMFYTALGAMVMVFVGAVFIDGALRSHPLAFLGYWGICAWLTLASALLAMFDILVVRAAGRAMRRKLEQELTSHDDDPNTD
jgi:hypothetical protein